MLADSFPSSTITEGGDSISCILFDFSDLQPLMQRILLLSRAKLSLVLMYETTSAYGSFLLSLIKQASRFIALVADGPAPPVHEKISGQNVLFSTLMTRSSYLLFLIASWYLYASAMFLGHDLACGLKTLTSKSVLVNLDSQNPFALMSSRASSSL